MSDLFYFPFFLAPMTMAARGSRDLDRDRDRDLDMQRSALIFDARLRGLHSMAAHRVSNALRHLTSPCL